MGPIEKILQFAKTHAVLTAAAIGTAGGIGYVAYGNYYREADRANGGAVVKQDIAVKDKRGDLSLKMQGLKEAATAKANEPTKADAKTDNGDTSKKLKAALDAAKDADIKAEAAKANELAVERAPKPEKPYIPETAADAAYNDTDANLLNGNGSAAFKPARFASSGGGSAFYEQNKGGETSTQSAGGRGQRKLFRERAHPL